jgi:uncharacterized membrane protein (UPF0127 family)
MDNTVLMLLIKQAFYCSYIHKNIDFSLKIVYILRYIQFSYGQGHLGPATKGEKSGKSKSPLSAAGRHKG